jgi:hypothetical protein
MLRSMRDWNAVEASGPPYGIVGEIFHAHARECRYLGKVYILARDTHIAHSKPKYSAFGSAIQNCVLNL